MNEPQLNHSIEAVMDRLRFTFRLLGSVVAVFMALTSVILSADGPVWRSILVFGAIAPVLTMADALSGMLAELHRMKAQAIPKE